MEPLFDVVLGLYHQGLSPKQIKKRGICSEAKARKILITAGVYSTPASEAIKQLLQDGKSVEEIAEIRMTSCRAVTALMPYSRGGMYSKKYPSKNALAIRKCREKKRDRG